MRILVLGGYGNFGARICRQLAGNAGLEVVAAGRHPRTAPADFAALGISVLPFDLARADLAQALRETGCGIIIHCVGPFQGQDYRVALAAAACGTHYIDIADGREFVASFPGAVDAAMRQAGRLAVSGASTLPALSAAVVDSLLPRFAALETISTVIAPAQRAPRGAATLAGVMSYAGEPFSLWRNGAWQRVTGWSEVRPVALGPLGERLSAVCDVPDLALFPERYAGVATVEFRAALEVGMQHRALAALAGLRRGGMPVPMATLAPFMESVARVFNPFGSETGGMEIRLTGRSVTGQPLSVAWRIIAPHNHGPEIPCMAAILMARRLAKGHETRTGAHACMGFLSLTDFEPEFARWGMTTHVEDSA